MILESVKEKHWQLISVTLIRILMIGEARMMRYNNEIYYF